MKQISETKATAIIMQYVSDYRRELEDSSYKSKCIELLLKCHIRGEIDEKTAISCVSFFDSTLQEDVIYSLINSYQKEGTNIRESFREIFAINIKIKEQRVFDFAGNLQSEELDPIDFLIEDILPQGVGWISGSPKAGKSFLMMQMAYCIASGKEFLGKKTKQSRVIYYSLEMAKNLVQDRLNLMFGNESWSNNLAIAYSLPVFEEGALDTIRDDVNVVNADLIIIDTYAFISMSKSSNKPLYEETYKEIAEIKRLAEELNITVVLVSHLNKNSLQTDDFDRMMGSVANRGASDFNMILANDTEIKGQKLFKQESRKSKGFDYVLSMNSNATFENLGSSSELQLVREKEQYLSDPVATAVKKLLLSHSVLEIKANDLYEKLPDYSKEEISTVIKLGNRINKLQFKLKKYDQITFSRVRRSDGQYYVFERPKNKIKFTQILDESTLEDNYTQLKIGSL